MRNLSDCKKGEFLTILGIEKSAPIKIRRRLLELGWTSGENVKVAEKSLLGRVFLVELRGYTLSMKKEIAKYVLVS